MVSLLVVYLELECHVYGNPSASERRWNCQTRRFWTLKDVARGSIAGHILRGSEYRFGSQSPRVRAESADRITAKTFGYLAPVCSQPPSLREKWQGFELNNVLGTGRPTKVWTKGGPVQSRLPAL